MCSRYAWVDLSLLDKGILPMKSDTEVQPRYNIAPSTTIPVIRFQQGEQVNENMLWGFRSPHGSEPIINARIETIKEKPMFRDAFKRQRCVMPADCFYEWKKVDGKKQPIKFFNANKEHLFLAGIWKDSVDHTGRIKLCCICTTEPNSLVAPVHNRMPLILTKPLLEPWLTGGELDGEEYEKYKTPYPASLLNFQELDTYVNNVRHEGPQCWNPPRKEEASLF